MPRPSFEARHSGPGDLVRCADILRAGSRSFHVASRLLPPRVRAPVAALYAFCRVADDAVDLDPDPRRRVAQLRERLDRAYRGRPLAHPVDRAFADVVASYLVPRAVPEALIEGLAWDAEGRDCPDLPSLEAYAMRVAGTVGVMMALVMGVRDPHALARACDLGVAMQFTNVARDIGEDARRGRLYLPRDWLAAAGVDAHAFLREPRYDERVRACVERLLETADRLYARGAAGIAALPRDCRQAIRAAASIYAEIGRRLARDRIDPTAERAVVSTGRKLRFVLGAAMPEPWPGAPAAAPPLESARFLIQAVAAAPFAPTPPRGLYDRTLWVVSLFEDLGRRERGLPARAAAG
jgi:phytoene synthase